MFMPANVFWGVGALRDNAQVLKTLGGRCLILTGGSSAEVSGALDDVRRAFEKNDVEYKIFSKISENPLLSVCSEAGSVAGEMRADFILGIGGGSVLDAAKAAAIYAAQPGLSPQGIYSRSVCEPLAVALVGTTAGTGSEVTGVSVLTHDDTGRKKSISGSDCYARFVFADPLYTATMPEKVTVSTALDAFSHAVEGWFAPEMNPFVELFAQAALPLIFKGLCRLASGAQPDMPLREQLCYGALLAGLVINTCGTAFPHPLGYVLTENYGVPHGQACAAFLPAFLRRAQKFASERLGQLERLLGVGSEEIAAVLRALSVTGDIVISPAAAREYAGRWRENEPKNFAASPGGLTPEEAAQLLELGID